VSWISWPDVEEGRAIPLWVMHPERCLRSRVANSRLPDKNTALAWRQLRVAIKLVAAFSRFLLDSDESPRLVMKLNERVFELAYYNRDAMRIYIEEGIDVFDAALVDKRLPERHLDIRLPQMRDALREKRDRRRA
jgi:hypothetical protein